jgi:hypothetical protein
MAKIPYQLNESTKNSPENRETEIQRSGDTESQRDGVYRDTDDTEDTEDSAFRGRVFSVQDAIKLSLERGFKAHSIWLFARAIKSFEQNSGHKLDSEGLDVVFSSWWRTAKPYMKDGETFAVQRVQFQLAYSKVKFALGENALDEAILRADKDPLPKSTIRYEGSPKLQRLVAVCYQLQLLAGNNPFFISTRSAAKLMGSDSASFGSDMLNGLVLDGVLKLIVRGSRGTRRSSRFIFCSLVKEPTPETLKPRGP